MQRSIKMGLHRFLVVLSFHGFHGTDLDDAGVIHNDINTAEMLFNLCDHVLNLFWLSDITGDTTDVRAFFK